MVQYFKDKLVNFRLMQHQFILIYFDLFYLIIIQINYIPPLKMIYKLDIILRKINSLFYDISNTGVFRMSALAQGSFLKSQTFKTSR